MIKCLIITFLLIFIDIKISYAENSTDSGFHFELGEEYSKYNRNTSSSPPTPSSGGRKSGFWRGALLYLPNRLFDFIDIFRIDVGVGVGYGGVIRPTKYLQAGYREFEPGMLRVGLMGRRYPFLIEEKDESGFGRSLTLKSKRKISKGELGVGVDLGIIGGYGGVCLDSAADFILGIIGIDFEDDDFQ